MSLFARLARSVARRPALVVVVWSTIAAAFFAITTFGVGPYGSLEDRTSTGPPEAKGSDSYAVDHAFNETVPADAPDRVSAQFLGWDPADPSVVAIADPLLAALAQREGVIVVTAPFGAYPGPAFTPSVAGGGGDPSILVTQGETGFLVSVQVTSVDGDDARLELHEALRHDLEDVGLALWNSPGGHSDSEAFGDRVHVFSTTLFFDSFEAQLQTDLVTGEAIALPLALLVMVIVFGGFLAASTPIAGAIASIAGGFAVVYGFTFIQHVDSAAQNVVTVLGIGLCIDYGLLIVSRFREEMLRRLAAGDADPRAAALERTMETAGRTVFFSGVTVGIAVGGLLAFKPEFLTGFGGASVGVVITAVASAMTLVPAVAYLFGEKIARPGVLRRVPGIRSVLAHTANVERERGAFSTLAAWVQRRPWLVLVGALAVLAVLASPALSLTLRNSEGETLPATDHDRQYLEAFNDRYPAIAANSVDGAAITLMADTTVAEFDAWAPALLDVDGVLSVAPALDQGGHVFSGLRINVKDEGSPEAVNLVHDLRALDPPFPLYVGGQAANQVDFIAAIRDGAPVAFSIVIAATFVLLFLMTGSLLVPVKALITNTLSLTASIGIVVWIFQEGHLASLLGFDSLGGIETYVVVLIISFGFGLAMDYEVFLLARIKELVDSGVPNDEAVRTGLQRSGRIITSAAAIIILVFLGFAAGKVLIIKEIGFGLAIAVFLDATLVRMLLVPATMTLLGKWNWWAPRGLKSLYARMAITH